MVQPRDGGKETNQRDTPIPLPPPPKNDEHDGRYVPPVDHVHTTDSRYRTSDFHDPPWYSWDAANAHVRKRSEDKCECCGRDRDDVYASGNRAAACKIYNNDYRRENHAYLCSVCWDRPDWRVIVKERLRPRGGGWVKRIERRLQNGVAALFTEPRDGLVRRRLTAYLVSHAVLIAGLIHGGFVEPSTLAGSNSNTSINVLGWVVGIYLGSFVIVHTADWTTRDPTGWYRHRPVRTGRVIAAGIVGVVIVGVMLNTEIVTAAALAQSGVTGSAGALSLVLIVTWYLSAAYVGRYIDETVKADGCASTRELKWDPVRPIWSTVVRAGVVLGAITLTFGVPGGSISQINAAIAVTTAIAPLATTVYGGIRMWRSGKLERLANSIFELDPRQN